MLTLYKNIHNKLQYWEVWKNDENSSIIHWGIVGEKGETQVIDSKFPEGEKLQKEVSDKIQDGYQEIDIDDQSILLVEYKVDNMGTAEDLSKRHALEDKLNEILGWTGLGHCDGGSIGSGTMEACCFVVDFDLAKEVIIANLKNTEFEDYDRIFEKILNKSFAIHIEEQGGAQSMGGTSSNAINAISQNNPAKQRYLEAANKAKGST